MEYDLEGGSITDLSGITCDEEERGSLGTHIIEELSESNNAIIWVRDDDLGIDYEKINHP